MYQILVEQVPFAQYKGEDIERMVLRGKRPARPNDLDDDLVWDVCDGCWADESVRPDIPAVVEVLERLIR